MSIDSLRLGRGRSKHSLNNNKLAEPATESASLTCTKVVFPDPAIPRHSRQVGLCSRGISAKRAAPTAPEEPAWDRTELELELAKASAIPRVQ